MYILRIYALHQTVAAEEGRAECAVRDDDLVEDADADGFPRPLTATEMAARAYAFWSRVAPMLAGYVALIAELEARTALNLPPLLADDEAARWTACHDDGSVALAAACNELQGFYAKTGQIIATRSDLFPPQYTDRLASLTDSCDPLPFELVQKVKKKRWPIKKRRAPPAPAHTHTLVSLSLVGTSH